MKGYFYQVIFSDGKIIRREYVTKRIAEAAYITFVEEMSLLNVEEATYGPMPPR